MIRPIIIDKRTQGECKIQLTIAINFISSKDTDEMPTVHSKSDNIEIMLGNETDENTEELFDSLLQKYQKRLKRINEGK